MILCPACYHTYLLLNFCYKGQQCHVPGALDRHSQLPLVFRAHPCLAAGANLAAVADKSAQEIYIFIVNRL